MAKKKIINTIYKGSFEEMTIDLANEYFDRAKGAYQNELERFERLYNLYKKPASNGDFDKNIVFELIESEIDNNIYLPKVKSSNGLIEQAHTLEAILKDNLLSAEFREYNDIQERNTYIFGGSVTLTYWDRVSRNSARGGKLKYKAIDPRHFIPQPGLKKIDDMDYMFTIESITKMKLQNIYNLKTDQLALLDGGQNINIDPDLVELRTMYYTDKFNHICSFIWCGTLVLENNDDVYSDKLYHCTKCGQIKEADEDVCIKCGSTEFELKKVERKKVIVRERINKDLENGEKLSYSKEVEVDVVPYVPNKYPIHIRKNISSDGLFGISDAEMIEKQQSLGNSILNKLAERVLKSGSLIGLPKSLRNKFKVDNSELKILYYDTPAEANGIIVKSLQPQIGGEPYLMDSAYGTARNTLGITNTFQGREDNSAISSKAKSLQIQQTAGRLESKKEMKKAGLITLYDLLFQFLLAYGYEYTGYYTSFEGEDVYKIFDNRLFLKQLDGKFFYDDEYIFDIDLSATLENNREAMWQENRTNYQSGAYGNPQELTSVRMFWKNMYENNYPGAKDNLDYIDKVIEQNQQKQEIENAFRQREIALKQSQITSQDLANAKSSDIEDKKANASILNSLKNE